jgi:hypothetical protein
MNFHIVNNSLIFSNKSYEEHAKWISKACKQQPMNHKEMYAEAYMKYSPEETSAEFRKKVNMVPWDIMRLVILHRVPLAPC